MSGSFWDRLSSCTHGELKIDEPLAGYSTYRIGGPAEAVFSPNDSSDVAAAVKFCSEQNVRWLALGLGSNVLLPDKGVNGLVIRLGKKISGELDRSEDGRWRVAAGMPTPRLAKRTADAGLSGIEGLVGVPGTVGGGVIMNAGSNGQDYSQVLESVEVVTRDGVVRDIPSTDIDWQYRSSGLNDVVVTAATMKFCPGDSGDLKDRIAQHLARRKATTPYNERCCGSVFKNPPVSAESEKASRVVVPVRTAGAMIDAAGLKGFGIGGAEVSSLHANYILNRGSATAADVRGVIDAVRERVFAEFGVELELEVRIIE